MVDRNFARLTTILLGVTPVFWVWSNQVMHEVPQTFFFITTLYFFYLAIKRDKISLYCLAGLFLGLGQLMKMQNIVVVPIMLLFAVYEKRKAVLNKKMIINGIVTIAIAVLVFSPYLIYRSVNSAPSFFSDQALTEIITGKAAWAPTGDISVPVYYYVTDIFNIISFGFIFFALGLIYFYKKREKPLWLALIWVAMCYLILSIFAHKVYRYMIIAIPAMVIVSVYGLYLVRDYLKNKKYFYVIAGILIASLAIHSIYLSTNDGYWPLNWSMWDDLKSLDNIVLSTDLYDVSTVDMAYGTVKLMTGKYTEIISGDPQQDASYALMYNTQYLLYAGQPEFGYPYVKLKYYEECNCTLYKIDEKFLFENKTLVKTTYNGRPLGEVNIYLLDSNGNVIYRSRSNVNGEVFIPAENYTGILAAQKICFNPIQTYIQIQSYTFNTCDVKQKTGSLGMTESYLECRPTAGLDITSRGCFDHDYTMSRF
jgi:hypothetical protein